MKQLLLSPIGKAVLSLILNLGFAFYNGIVGGLTGSRIFIASCIYYLILSSLRFVVIITNRKQKINGAAIGDLLIILSTVMGAVVFISIRDNTATVYGTVTMITIATYIFAKIITAAFAAKKQKRTLDRTLNTIRLAEVAVSLLTMQQSMLVSFGDSELPSAYILNICTGTAVCLFILALGGYMITNSRKENIYGKSKLVQAYQKVEDTVVGGYKAVENTVVGGYTKIEDKFVEQFLLHEGESIEDAKKRLKSQQ